MNIHLGYVSISKILDITPSKTITYKEFKKHNDLNIINNIIIKNLTNLEKIIDYNIKNNIHFYRLTSKLIPLSTIKELNFDYIKPYLNLYKRIGDKIIGGSIHFIGFAYRINIVNILNHQQKK